MNRSLLVCLALWLSPSAASSAQPPTLDPFEHPRHRQIEQILAQERHMAFNNATLLDLVSYLNSEGIPAHLDRRALDDAGIAPDARVTLSERTIRLSDGLTLLLRDHDLTWFPVHGQLLITTQEEAENMLITKIYDVRHLVELRPQVVWSRSPGVSSQTTYEYDFDALIELIISTIAADSWADVGGSGSIEPYWTRNMRVLVIAQTYDVHQQIETLLRTLARFGGRQPLPPTPARIPLGPSTRSAAYLGEPAGQAASSIRTSRLRMTGR